MPTWKPTRSRDSARRAVSRPPAPDVPGGEAGATIVEMALVLPLFLVLVMGILEFSFVLAQNNEVRHVAREGARVAGVEDGGDVAGAICGNLNLLSPAAVTFSVSAPSGGEAGTVGQVQVEAEYASLTGIGSLFVPDGITLRSEHNFFVEPEHSPSGGSGC